MLMLSLTPQVRCDQDLNKPWNMNLYFGICNNNNNNNNKDQKVKPLRNDGVLLVRWLSWR